MRIEDYELNHMNREYKINTISLRFLVAITILTAIFLVYAVHSTIKTRNEIEAAQESLAIRASQLQSDLEELKREIEATPTPTHNDTDANADNDPDRRTDWRPMDPGRNRTVLCDQLHRQGTNLVRADRRGRRHIQPGHTRDTS